MAPFIPHRLCWQFWRQNTSNTTITWYGQAFHNLNPLLSSVSKWPLQSLKKSFSEIVAIVVVAVAMITIAGIIVYRRSRWDGNHVAIEIATILLNSCFYTRLMHVESTWNACGNDVSRDHALHLIHRGLNHWCTLLCTLLCTLPVLIFRKRSNSSLRRVRTIRKIFCDAQKEMVPTFDLRG